MTSFCIWGPEDSPLLEPLRQCVARKLAAGFTLLRGGAEITVSLEHDVTTPHGGILWTLAWADGAAFSETGTLLGAACKPHAVVELVLAERAPDGWKELRRAAFSPEPGSLPATIALACDRAALLITQAGKDAHRVSLPTAFVLSSTIKSAPPALTLRLLWRRLCQKAYAIAMRESWMIGIVDAPIETSLQWTSCPQVRWIGERSEKRYLADPFMWPGDASAILCEDYNFRMELGSIKRLMLEDTRIVQESPVRIPPPGHASYPFLFAHDGNVYCLPETSAVRCLMLLSWENRSFREVSTPLANTAAADSVLFTHEGRFWIAYTDTDIGRFDNLNLCYAESLAGPWRQHPGNPVKLDPRSSRAGGTPFSANGRLYRPAQDCSETYGGAIRIMRIAECTPERYREEEVTRIAPEQGGANPHGFHTLSAFGDACLVDGKRMMFSPADIYRKVKKRLKGA
jgi:hypothetical protein